MKNSNYKAVIFDMDGTLLNTLSDLADSGNYVLEKLKLNTYSEQEYRKFIGNGIQNLIVKMMPEKSSETELKEAYDEFCDYYSENNCNKTAAYPGVEEVLRELCSRGIKTGIITNKIHVAACEMTERFFKGLVGITLGARDNIPNKPDPASLLEMIELFGLKKDEVLFVGDSVVDIKTAKNAGVKSCGVLWGFGSREEIVELGADFLAENAEELCRVIFNME